MESTSLIYIDIAIFIFFFLLNIAVGFRYRNASTTFREYAIGDKKFSTAILTATIVATWMSGSSLFINLEGTYGRGLYHAIATIVGITLGLLITGYVVGPRMSKFLNNVSVPDSLGKLYGKHTQIITGISAVLSSIGYVAIQFKVISKILGILFNYEGPEVVIISATIITLYSFSGGVKAVTFTDVIQFLTFGALLPILALTIWYNLGDADKVLNVVNTNPLFNVSHVVRWTPEFMQTLMLLSYYACPGLPPELFQRMAMARDVKQVQRSIGYATLACLGITLCSTWIAVLLLADRPGLAPSELINYIVHHHAYPGLRGFLGIGIAALAMSTADSALNSTAVLISNDIFAPLLGNSQEKAQKRSLTIAKWSTLGLGACALVLALYVQGLLRVLLLSASFYGPITIIPMLLAIFGFQTTTRVVYMAITAGLSTVILYLVYFPGANSFFPGMLANLVVMLGAHYLLGEKGGWGHNPIEKRVIIEEVNPNTWQGWWESAKHFNFSVYFESILPKQANNYALFGFYIFTAGYTSFYLLPHGVAAQCPNIYKLVQYSIPLIGTCFVTYPIWPPHWQQSRMLTSLWPLSLFYALFFISGLLVIASGFSNPQMLIFMLNFAMAVLLTNGPLAVTMGISGTLLSLWTFHQITGLVALPDDLGSLHFKIIYGLLASSSFLIALFRQQEGYKSLQEQATWLSTERQTTRQELMRAREHEKRFFAEVTADGQEVLNAINEKVEQFKDQSLELGTPEKVQAVQESVQEIRTTLKDTMNYLRSVVYRVQDHVRLDVKQASLDVLMSKAIAIARNICSPEPSSVKYTAYAPNLTIQCDRTRIQQLVINGVMYAHQHNPQNKFILVDVQPTKLSYPLSSVADHIKKVDAFCITITPEKEVPAPHEFYMGNVGEASIQLPRNVKELGLADNLRIVHAHYGAAEAQKGAAGLTQMYVVPVQLRDVRPKMMDIPEMEAGSHLEAIKTVHNAEKALIKSMQNVAGLDMHLVQKAINTIKKHHAPVKRKSGEPFYLHPVAATEILLTYSQDPNAVLATLLHDTVEDTALTLSEIAIVFGHEVAKIVDKVTHLDGELRRVAMDDYENIKQLLNEQDKRVLQVKLADRLHNMRTIHGHSSIAKRKKIAMETQQFFIPITRQLGLEQVEQELQCHIDEVMKL